MLFKKRGQKKNVGAIKQNSSNQISKRLNKSLDDNVSQFKDVFTNDDTLIVRYFQNQHNTSVKCCIMFIDGMVNVDIINENLIKPIVKNTMLDKSGNILDILKNQVIISSQVSKTTTEDEVIEGILNGNTVLFLDGYSEALIINTKGWEKRAISEPETEKGIRGSREGFTETLKDNLSMIRRKLKTKNLKFRYMTIGMQSNTKVCICYIEGIANEKIVNEVYKRLINVEIDGILSAEYIAELIKDAPLSPFETIGNTERPDIVAAKLLDGRVAIIIDGTPEALTVPFTFIEYFQSSDDYYLNYYFAIINRVLRIVSFIITISGPAIYVALLTYHQEMIPTPLVLSISAARKGLPFPTTVETIGLLVTFEILRETGIRMSSNVGQALSIVGALVLGQAAVEAKIVSAPVVIIVSLSALTGLITPKINGAAIIIRAVFLLIASMFGLYGYVFGITGLLLHLCGMRSFGIPYMLNLDTLDPEAYRDTIIRAPWWYMKFRPKLIAAKNRIRKATEGGRR